MSKYDLFELPCPDQEIPSNKSVTMPWVRLCFKAVCSELKEVNRQADFIRASEYESINSSMPDWFSISLATGLLLADSVQSWY